MTIVRRELKELAREKLKGKWGNAVLLTFVYMLIITAISLPLNFLDAESAEYGLVSLVTSIVSFIVTGPLSFGLVTYFISLVRDEDVEILQLFTGFKMFGKTLGLYFFMVLFILLWSLLLIIPGIIASLRYSQAFYILRDNPEMSPLEAINKSKELMDGRKADLFMLGLSFIGWSILCIFTLFIGFLWLAPYMNATFALFYEKLIQKESDVIEVETV